MSENWLDKESTKDKRFTDQELQALQQKYQHTEEIQNQRREVFGIFKILIATMFVLGYFMLGMAIEKPSSFSAIIAAIAVMVPLVLTLAMLRMLYGNNNDKKEKTIPSITFNVGKELKSVIMAYLKKQD